MLFRLCAHIDERITNKIGVLRCRRLAKVMTGFIPAIGTLVMVIHCATLLFGYDLHIASFLFKYSLMWWILLSCLSIGFGFCWVHRAFCFYNWMMGFMIEHQRLHGFGEWVTPLRWLFLIIGTYLIVAYLHNRCWRNIYDNKA